MPAANPVAMATVRSEREEGLGAALLGLPPGPGESAALADSLLAMLADSLAAEREARQAERAAAEQARSARSEASAAKLAAERLQRVATAAVAGRGLRRRRQARRQLRQLLGI